MSRSHEVLGLRPGASDEEIRAAFRRFARRHHPDRGGDPEAFRLGLEAYRGLLGLEPSEGGPDLVFHRRPRGVGLVTAAWRGWRGRRRSARVM